MLLCIAKEALFKHTTVNNTLCTEVSSQTFYRLSIMLSPENSLSITLWLPYIFIGETSSF